MQSALESGSVEGRERAAQLYASLAEAQRELREAQEERHAAQERLEELQETLYNQVGHLPDITSLPNSVCTSCEFIVLRGMSRASSINDEAAFQGTSGDSPSMMTYTKGILPLLAPQHGQTTSLPF